MSQTPRINLVLFVSYIVITIVVFVGASVLPSFRSIANAPLREVILPAPAPIVVPVLYSTEKESWLNEVVADFESSPRYRVDGRPIRLEMKKMGSREMILDVLDGVEEPVLLSPASSLQASILESQSASKFGKPLANAANCRSVVNTPLVLVAWRERAQILWGDNPPDQMWHQVHDVLVDPQGWAAYDHPDWGYIKFGHTDPLKSNSGFMTVLLMTYDYFGKTSGLTSADLLSDTDYQQWLIELESTVSNFGDSTGTYMKEIVAYGPSMHDIVTVYEATAIEHAENAVGRYGELRVYYPPATVMSDHPFCILDADWVSPEQTEAAQMFIDYLQTQPVQELALLKYGFRPTNPAVPLEQPGSPFERYVPNGLRVDLPPQVEVPPGDVLDTLLDFWLRNIQR